MSPVSGRGRVSACARNSGRGGRGQPTGHGRSCDVGGTSTRACRRSVRPTMAPRALFGAHGVPTPGTQIVAATTPPMPACLLPTGHAGSVAAPAPAAEEAWAWGAKGRGRGFAEADRASERFVPLRVLFTVQLLRRLPQVRRRWAQRAGGEGEGELRGLRMARCALGRRAHRLRRSERGSAHERERTRARSQHARMAQRVLGNEAGSRSVSGSPVPPPPPPPPPTPPPPLPPPPPPPQATEVVAAPANAQHTQNGRWAQLPCDPFTPLQRR